MKYATIFILTSILLLISSTANAQNYDVLVSWRDLNRFEFVGGGARGFILTKACYLDWFPVSERAILHYEKYSSDNKLIFLSRAGVKVEISCEIEKVDANLR